MDASTIGFVVLAIIVLLIIARVVYRLLLGQGMTETLINNDNKAAAVSLAGFLLGVIQVVIPVLTGPSHSFWADVKGVAAYGIGGIIAMAVAAVAVSRLYSAALSRYCLAVNMKLFPRYVAAAALRSRSARRSSIRQRLGNLPGSDSTKRASRGRIDGRSYRDVSARCLSRGRPL